MKSEVTYEIHRSEWVSFFNAFSINHQRSRSTMEIIGPEIGAQVEGRRVRFESINADLKDREDCITIAFGEPGNGTLIHAIANPIHVWVGESPAEIGTFETLDIESADGVKTLVHFLPEFCQRDPKRTPADKRVRCNG